MPSRWSRVLLLLLLGACSAPFSGRVEPPEVSIAGLGFGTPGLFEQELRLDLRLANPNDFAIAIDRLAFALDLNRLRFATGRTAQEFELPALGETVVPVAITVPTDDLVDRMMQLGNERRLDYRLTGEAELGGLLGLTLPFTREGVLSLPRIPGLAPPDA